jgi:uncharacterized lipoprotein YmbA
MSARAFVAIAIGAVLLGGCGSSPNSTFYALSPTQGAAQKGAPHAIKVRRVTIPGYLDRPEIVRRVVDFKLGIDQYERWGEPLDAMLGRVLAADIELRTPGSTVFTEDGSITADLRDFAVGAGGEVNLDAEIAVERGTTHDAASSQGVSLRKFPKDGSTASLVSAMSDLLGQLGDRVAAMLHGR